MNFGKQFSFKMRMKSENILAVIDELGSIIINYRTTVAIDKYERERLEKKILEIEQHIESYLDNDPTESEYKELIK